MKSLKAKIKKIYSSEFFKHSATLLSSNAIAQVIAIFVYPFITRIYNTEAFGEFNLFLSIVGILTLLTTGKYELAIVLPKSERQATALFQLSLLITVTGSILVFIIIGFWKESIAIIFRKSQLVELLPFLPYYLLLGGLWQILNYYFVRQKKYYNISINTFTQSILGSALKVWFGFKGFLQYGLVWGQFGGQLVAVLVSVISGRKSFKQLKHWDKQAIKEAAKTYSNFPKYELPHGFINSIAGNLPILLLSVYFDMEVIGLFALAFSIGFRPINLFSNSVCQVLFGKVSEQLQNGQKIKNDLWIFCKSCTLVILPVFILLLFIPESAFEVLFGRGWGRTGFYLKLMLPGFFVSFFVASLAFVPNIFFKQKTSMNIEIVYLILKIIALLSGVYFGSFNLAIILYSSVVTFMLTIKLIWYFRLIKKYEHSL
jgi:O-antigen/teichoic acid export membrane protein